MRTFIAIYTNRCKDYCDTEFLDNVHKLSRGNPVFLVDNTIDDGQYLDRLDLLTRNYKNFRVNHVQVPREPTSSQFQRNVCQSVNLCRDAFLASNCDHMLILESDVLPPTDLLERLEDSVLYLTGEKWGIIGGIYYHGFHDYNLTGLQPTHHVLSGCSLYNRDLITDTPFRYEEVSLAAFPDAFMSFDAIDQGYSLWNDHAILCQHIEISPGDRGQGKL